MEIYHPERSRTGTVSDYDPPSQEYRTKLIASFYSEGLAETVESKGIRADVPRVFLHGTQPKEEYSQRKRRQVEALLNQRGIDFLRENPVIVCAIPINETLTFAIIDGHHRARYSSNFGIYEVPCVVLSLQELAEVKNESNRRRGVETNLDAQGIITTLRHDIATTVASFSRSMPSFKLPLNVPPAHHLYTTVQAG